MQVNVFLLIQRDQGDRLGELKFVMGLQHLSFHLAHWKLWR